ncbi:MAG: hypothetical protein K6A65_05915 [Succinivibrionaceae bacterium]|nr:hypothetical protein [Succinivibrionaceae bacterium]
MQTPAPSGPEANRDQEQRAERDRLLRTPGTAEKARQDRFRKNIRTIGLMLAAYYFCMAGYEWWKEGQQEDARAAAAELARANGQDLVADLTASLDAAGVRRGEPQVTIHGFALQLPDSVLMAADYGEDRHLQSARMSYPEGPAPAAAARAFVSALEGGEEQAEAVLQGIGGGAQGEAATVRFDYRLSVSGGRATLEAVAR